MAGLPATLGALNETARFILLKKRFFQPRKKRGFKKGNKVVCFIFCSGRLATYEYGLASCCKLQADFFGWRLAVVELTSFKYGHAHVALAILQDVDCFLVG